MKSNATVPVSYGELARQGIHALRGLGYSFSVAERAAHTLAATEAATGLGLKCLQSSAPQIEAAMAKAVTVATPAPGVTRIDAGGKSLLELSPFLLDVASADAERLGRSAVLADNLDGMPFVADLALRAAAQGRRLLAFYTGGAALPAAPAMFRVENGQIRGDAVAAQSFWPKAARCLEESPLSAIVPALQAPAVEGRGRLLIVAGTEDAHVSLEIPEPDARRAAPTWQAADAWKPAFDRAIRSQIDTGTAGFDFFYQCVRRIWAPTSERSRAQQG